MTTLPLKEKIGFVGLGLMGKPVAEHLLAAGHRPNFGRALGIRADDSVDQVINEYISDFL